MKRHLLIIAICLLLGAVVNVAVAWGCAAWVDLIGVVPDSKSPQRRGRYQWQTFDYFERVGASRMAWRVSPMVLRSGPDGETVNQQDEYMGTLPQVRVPDLELGEVVDRRGWPLLSMQCTFVNVTRDVWKPRFEVRHGFELTPVPSSDERGLRALPLAPIWLAFIADTLFYAVVLWLLIPGPFVLRRFWRVQQGLCPKCAYPMGESEVCTECGCGLPKHASTT